MDPCRVIKPDDLPPIHSPTLFVHKNAEATYLPGGKRTKTALRYTLSMADAIKNGDVKCYISWIGQWSTDIFILPPESVDAYMAKVQTYL